MSPWQKRDVIEIPIEDDLDINGWDLGKAIKLVLKGNAVILEWLSSPIVYAGLARFHDDLLSFATRHASRERIGRHYLHLGERQRRTYFGDGKQVELKKIFYALRPAAALRWLRLHPESALPPMEFPKLMAQCEPPETVAVIAADLIRKKAVTRELGTAPLPGPINEFVDSEFAEAALAFEKEVEPTTDEARRHAEQLFREWVSRTSLAPGTGT